MNININQCKLFIQSFNRSNLIYECTPKGTTDTALKKIANLIISHYLAASGIVYCFSRAECDKTGILTFCVLFIGSLFVFQANYLSAYKIKALSYHAGLSDSKRQLVQNQWANDDCQVERNNTDEGLFSFHYFDRLFVQPSLLEWVLINQMFVLLFIFQCRNRLKFVLRIFLLLDRLFLLLFF